MSLLPDQFAQINELEHQIENICFPSEPPTALKLFENKQFNTVKKDMPHLSTREITDYIYQEWKFKLSKEEREAVKEQAMKANGEYMQIVLKANKLKSELKEKIHDIKYSNDNPAVKPSGKLKYMSAYRFFRKEMVPLVKG